MHTSIKMGIVIFCISRDLQVPERQWRSGKAPGDNVFQLLGRWGDKWKMTEGWRG